MAEPDTAQPQWISPPGEIVARILALKHIELDDFATRIGLTARFARGLIEGTTPIDRSLAERLALALGSTPSFWLRCEQSYREDKIRNLPAYVDDEVKSWLKRMPLREMSRLGWVRLRADPIKQAEECFKFFGVVSLDEWKRRHVKLLSNVNFRTSHAFSMDPMAASAWLRWTEERAEDLTTDNWNRSRFEWQLDNIRKLSRNHHPERFIPKLREICASSGVALVIAPAPQGCRASGATRLIRRRKAMIAMSFRYYVDDHFWFTFFHEAAHLLLHADQELFLEDSDGSTDQRESEANSFAAAKLVPPELHDQMKSLPPLHRAYIQFANEIGIAPGIVVGQMQRLGLLPYNLLRKLKRRFDLACTRFS
jgi:plasmid maintenance system antidote protein VapI/Zn-dependent peptidase ImmA (M78 family)